jgi:hypothetical protein
MPDATYEPLVYRKQGGNELVIASGGKVTAESGAALLAPLTQNLRARVAIADVNAGYTLVPAIAGYKHRMIDCHITAIGGAAGAVTTVDILGTQSSAAKLVAFAQANLTQNTMIRANGTGGTILAAGASFTLNDANTAITIGKTGSAVTTATHFDVVLLYATEAA